MRPIKLNADYHPHDRNLRNDPKLKALRNKYGHEGYSVYTMLMETLTGCDYFRHAWTDLDIELLSADYGTDKLKEIVDYCTNKLLEFTIENGFLSCSRHVNSFDPLLSKRERDRTRVFAAKTTVIGDENPHSKVKESKVKESRVEESKAKEESLTNSTTQKAALSAPATSAGAADKSGGKKEKPKDTTPGQGRPFWQSFVDGWFTFYKSKHSGNEPNFLKRNPAHARDLYDLLKNRATKKSIAWTAENMLSSLVYFLGEAWENDPSKWIQNHFTLENLVKQFDPIYARAREVKQKKTFEEELGYIMGRYIEDGKVDARLITHELYVKLEKLLLVPAGYKDRFKVSGTMTPEDQEVLAVKAFLETNKRTYLAKTQTE